ncbi:MAG: ABC transporter ATP-binding protein [Oscillospiraceae bacterium]|nr:ABC transporter ATP-binding protein [Oscillospiraceae bacterium]
MQNIIETKNVTRCFKTGSGEFWALKGVDVAIPEGQLTILKGRSGSGKTTLLNILGALDKPTGGQVLLSGEDISQFDEKRAASLRRAQIGFVFQSVALIPMMTAFENVEYALRLSGYCGDREARVRECLKLVGLSQRMKHLPGELSGGEQQRVAIARAIAHKPRILFADEPTAELDTLTGLQVVKIFKELTRQEGVTVVMTTHDVGLMELGDKVYALEDGEVATDA